MSTGPTDPITLDKVFILLQTLNSNVQAIDTRLQVVEANQAAAMSRYNTAPSWVSQITDEMRTGFASLKKEMVVLQRDLHQIKIDNVGLEERIDRLEEKR